MNYCRAARPTGSCVVRRSRCSSRTRYGCACAFLFYGKRIEGPRIGNREFLETPDLKQARQEIRRLNGALDILSKPIPGHDAWTPKERNRYEAPTSRW